MKTTVSIIGITMIFSVVMCAFIFFYQQAISKGIPVIVSEHQFHHDYFEEFGNTLIQKNEPIKNKISTEKILNSLNID